MDIKGVSRQPGAHGHSQHIPAVQQGDALHAQFPVMLKRPFHRDALQHVIPVGILLGADLIPLPDHLLSLGHVVRGNGLDFVVGVFCLKTVEMVPLFLIFSTSQVGQIIDGIDIVKAVPVTAEDELSGKPFFQLLPVFGQNVGDTAGDATLLGIFQDLLQDGPLVPGADGVGVDAAAVKVGEKSHTAMDKCRLLLAPEKQVGKRILTAPWGTGKENLFVAVFLG